MKLELNEITKSPQHDDHFEVRKDGSLLYATFYGEDYGRTREQALELAKLNYEKAKNETGIS